MYEFLALKSAVHLCERLRALRSVCSTTTITIFINVTSFGADKKFKINKRTNNKWKLEISQFMTDIFVEIY